MAKCASCSMDVPGAAKFCPSCGASMTTKATDQQDMLQTAVSLPPVSPAGAGETRGPGLETQRPATMTSPGTIVGGGAHSIAGGEAARMAATQASPSLGSRAMNEMAGGAGVPGSSTPVAPVSMVPMPASSEPERARPARAAAGTAIFAGAELGRFVPGTMFGDRYRIVGRLGKGGMGDVYRADDVKLGQPCAMKFLPEQLSQDRAALLRLVNEVKVARAVSHPNVCRVYDLGDEHGQHFISMEYVDGEDLSSLLRRIGRLPGDKALQISRQLAAGLASAHEKGVLHRDLKPANVMVDGRGHVRIMDFGLAGLAEELKSDTGRAGTPAYMAPEQLAGRGVTARSDVYALGLLFYEIFSGRPVFRPESMQDLQRLHKQPIAALSTIVPDVDPGVENVIMKCLERDPDLRPASALNVVQLLGGDALTAALAAGETPSPELVAASGSRGALTVPIAAAVLLSVVLGVFGAAALNGRVKLFASTQMPQAPVTLADKAREALRAMGHGRAGADSAYGVEEIRPAAVEGQPAPSPRLRFWYRESDRALMPGTGGMVGRLDPPVSAVGERTVLMDLEGNIVEMLAPAASRASESAPEAGADEALARAVVERTALDGTRLRAVESSDYVPAVYSTAKKSYTSVRKRAGAGAAPVRVDIATVGSTVVHLRVRDGSTDVATNAQAAEVGSGWVAAAVVGLVILGLHAVPMWMATWSLRQGKADRKGAARLAVVTFGVSVVAWLCRAHFAPDPEALINATLPALSMSAYLAAMVWMLYVGLEPVVRKRWPLSLVSWARLLAGSWRDPLVGRDLLIGALAGVLWVLLVQGVALWQHRSVPGGAALGIETLTLLGAMPSISVVMSSLIGALIFTLAITFVCTLPRFVLGNAAAANAAVFALLAVVFAAVMLDKAGSGEGSAVVALAGLLAGAVAGVLLTRLGLLTLLSASFVAGVLWSFPLALAGGGWAVGASIGAIAITLALAGFGAFASLGLRQPSARMA